MELPSYRLADMNTPCFEDRKSEEWVGDGVLTLALRELSVELKLVDPYVDPNIVNREWLRISKKYNPRAIKGVQMCASNDFLHAYSTWLRIPKPHANDLECRFCRLYKTEGFEAVKVEAMHLFNTWSVWYKENNISTPVPEWEKP